MGNPIALQKIGYFQLSCHEMGLEFLVPAFLDPIGMIRQ